MRSEGAQIGQRVRVRNDHRKSELRGLEGIVVNRWGDPSYSAFDVLLDDGDLQLFWYHELEKVGEDESDARGQSGAIARS